MRATLRMVTLIVCLFSFPLVCYSQVFDNQCPTGQSSIVPLRTVNITNGHFNDTACADTTGNLIFQGLGASLSASDTFTRANSSTLGPNWVNFPANGVSFTITSNAAKGASGTTYAAWKDPSFVSTAQFSQVTISIALADSTGPAVFVGGTPGGSGVGYACLDGTATLIISRRSAGGGTTLVSTASASANGDVIRLEIDSAGNMTCYKNGVSTLTATDTTFRNGAPGIFNASALSSMTNWSGGNLPVSIGTGVSELGTATVSRLNDIIFIDGVTYTTIDSAIRAVPVIGVTAAGATESVNTVTITTISAHGLKVNQGIYIFNMGVSGYNGFYTVATAPTATTFTYTNPTAGLGASGGGTVSPMANIIIPSTYVGAEASTCSSVDNAGNDQGTASGYRVALTPPNIHIEDRRGTNACNYNIAYNSGQIGARPSNISAWRLDASPTLTSSNVVTDLQVTGTIPSAQSMAGGTFEVDTVGNITTPGAPFIQALNGQWAVRSVGGIITQIMGVAGGGGIDRAFNTTNITQATGVYAFDPKNTGGSGTITDSYALIAAQPTTGTRNNAAVFNQGKELFVDQGGIQVNNAAGAVGPTGVDLLIFGGLNNPATTGITYKSPPLYGGTPFRFVQTAGTTTNWLIGAQVSATNSFEVTPSTAAGGNTFTNPGLRVSNNGAGGITTTTLERLATVTNCSSSASPAVCGTAAAGSFVMPAAATSVTVNTTAVTANSQIFIEEDDSLGTKLSVTCNTAATPPGLRISARVATTSFTITVAAAPVTNPECYSYFIVN